jgi:hypothetical protein
VNDIFLDNEPFSFEEFPWLRQIYADDDQWIIVRKATQLGFTTWAILRCLHGILTRYTRGVMYFMPTAKDVTDFVKTRVNPVLESNPQIPVDSTDNVHLKMVAGVPILFRGMKSNIALKSQPADCVVFDEVDEADPSAVEMAEKRMSASSFKHRMDLSNPTYPDYGVEKVYQSSDQRVWHLRCSHCGKWSAPDLHFPLELNQRVPCIGRKKSGRHYLRCEHCRREVDPRAEGLWVPSKTSKGLPHGYWMSQLTRPQVNLTRLLHKYRTTELPQQFYNLDIGVPWVDSENKLSEEDVLRLCDATLRREKASEHTTTMGIDTGKHFHWFISGWHDPGRTKRRMLSCGVATSWSDLSDLLSRFSVGLCIIDALPLIHDTKDWTLAHKPIVYRNYFSEMQKQRAKWDDDEWKVEFNRNEAFDAHATLTRQEVYVLPRRTPSVEMLARHWAADAKTYEIDKDTGAIKVEWRKLGENHLHLAAIYDMMCWRFRGITPAAVAPTDKDKSGRPRRRRSRAFEGYQRGERKGYGLTERKRRS